MRYVSEIGLSRSGVEELLDLVKNNVLEILDGEDK